MGSAETDRNSLGQNSKPQFYTVVAMPLFRRILASMNRIENLFHYDLKICFNTTLGSPVVFVPRTNITGDPNSHC